jgi:catechol 2,3-dioxygenase-like lactoylglutathione lyase family enzyme
MRINHLDLPTSDLPATRAFFVDHLDFVHQQTLGQDGLSILRDGAGMVLVLSRLQREGAQSFPQGFHVGFHFAEESQVHALYARLRETGVTIQAPTVQRGALSFYFQAPGEILVEVAHRP